MAYESRFKNSLSCMTILISVYQEGKIVTLAEYSIIEREFPREMNV